MTAKQNTQIGPKVEGKVKQYLNLIISHTQSSNIDF